MNIGTFTRTEDGYIGSIRTVVLTAKVKLVRNEKKSEKAPDFRVLMGSLEIGGAWKHNPADKRPHLSLSIDDPSFPAPIYSSLIEEESGELTLIWSRRKE